MKTLAIIQARMGSSRLPGKVLLDLAGKPMLQRVLERVRRARTVDELLIATTTDPADDPIAAFSAAQGIAHHRGAVHDVLDRYYQAARPFQPQVVIRITADCPLIDPALIDQTVALGASDQSATPEFDFACNRLPPPFTRTFPIGLDVEVCTFAALERAWREATEPFHREHVMPFLYEGVTLTAPTQIAQNLFRAAGISPRGFRIAQLHHHPDYGHLRWTVDTPEDLAFLRALFPLLPATEAFTWYDVLRTVQQHPELQQINANVRHKTMTEVDERNAESRMKNTE